MQLLAPLPIKERIKIQRVHIDDLRLLCEKLKGLHDYQHELCKEQQMLSRRQQELCRQQRLVCEQCHILSEQLHALIENYVHHNILEGA